jgi:FMN phosphatase YigB (HAD superfamily)
MSLASYDIWDTVLRRNCHPDAIKLHTARLLIVLGGSQVKPHLRDPWLLLHFRQLAERTIGQTAQATGLDDEYAIEEVLRAWIQVTTNDLSMGQIDRIAEDLLNAEIEREMAMIYLDPTIEQTFAADGSQRRIFVSDFYMGKQHLWKLLEKVGAASYFHDGYVSCDVRLNKRSGRLFEHVLVAEKMEAARISHWGDNHHSDFHSPGRFGINANHYVPEQEHCLRLEREARFHQQAERIAALLKMPQTSPQGIERLSDKISPLFVGFLLFVQEQVIHHRLDKIFFFTREGEFFVKIYEALRQASPFKDKLPKAKVLEVSRISTFGPSIREVTASELMRVWNLYSTQSAGALLKTLDLSATEFGHFFTRQGIGLDVPIQYPWQDKRMIAVLEDREFRDAAEAALSARRANFLAYCNVRGLNTSVERCAVVDIGWRGTIQDNIACMLPDTHFVGLYLGLSKLLNVQPPNVTKIAFGPDLNLNDASRDRRLLEFVAPIEMLANSPSGSVQSFVAENGEVRAQRLVSADENAVYESFTERFQAGILAAAARHAVIVNEEALGSDQYREPALRVWHDLIHSPDELIARAYFSLSHNETFGVGGFVEKSIGLGLFWPLRLLLSPGYRKTFRQRLSRIGWTSGYVAVKKDRLLMPILNTFYNKT